MSTSASQIRVARPWLWPVVMVVGFLACSRPMVTVPVQESLQTRLQRADSSMQRIRGENIFTFNALRTLYRERQFEPGWSVNGRLKPCVDSMIHHLSDAEGEGLSANVYHLEQLRQLRQPRQRQRNEPLWSADELADLDILLSDALLLFASHLQSGRVNPATFDAEWHVHRDSADVVHLLAEVFDRGLVCQRLLDLRPQHPSYRRLCSALATYQQYAQKGGWPQVEYVAKLEPGAYSPRISQVRRRLAVTGEWSAEQVAGDTLLYDDQLVQSVKLFQKRHGLEEDGVIGWSTVQEMNVTAEERCRQITVNLERWRWLYRDLGEYYILVNIPTFELEVVEHDSIVMTMKVVVGKPARRTPVLSDVMTHVVLNPYWNVPVSIILQDMIPEIRRNPRYLSDRGIRIYPSWDITRAPVDPQSVDWHKLNRNNLPYLFRQDPGPENALGRVKFVLHNDYDVYLHDTPARGLFARSERAFSSGCIRVQEPLRLAQHLLARQPSWTAEAIHRVLQSNREVTIVLPQPYNIHLQYWTAWINGDGQLRFARDIYLRDQRVADALTAQPIQEKG